MLVSEGLGGCARHISTSERRRAAAPPPLPLPHVCSRVRGPHLSSQGLRLHFRWRQRVVRAGAVQGVAPAATEAERAAGVRSAGPRPAEMIN